MGARKSEPSFDFAISFAGTDRPTAERIASLLSDGGAAVFIDTRYRAHLVGKRLDREFERVFGSGTRYFVPIVSRSYVDGAWPQHEWSVAVKEAMRRSEEFILPFRLDDSLLVGLPSQIGYIDLGERSLEQVADLLLQKVRETHRGEVTHWVATFGILIEEVLSSDQLPRTAPTDYAHLCDWLVEDLFARLRRYAGSPQLTEDSRNGESFSVRVAFDWNPQEHPLEFAAMGWWELLEVVPYDDVYEEPG
jgi:hypothetical protein